MGFFSLVKSAFRGTGKSSLAGHYRGIQKRLGSKVHTKLSNSAYAKQFAHQHSIAPKVAPKARPSLVKPVAGGAKPLPSKLLVRRRPASKPLPPVALSHHMAASRIQAQKKAAPAVTGGGAIIHHHKGSIGIKNPNPAPKPNKRGVIVHKRIKRV